MMEDIDAKRKIREAIGHFNPHYFDEMVKNHGTEGVHRRFQQYPTCIFYNVTQHSMLCNSYGRAIGCAFPGGGIVDKNFYKTYPECYANSYATNERAGPMTALEGFIPNANFNTTLGGDINQNKISEQISDEMGELILTDDWSASRPMAYQFRIKMDVAARYKLTGKIRGCCIPPATSMYDFNLPIRQKDYMDYPYPVEHDILSDGDIFTMAWKCHTLAAAKQYLMSPMSSPEYGTDGSNVVPTYPFVGPLVANGHEEGLEGLKDYVWNYKEFQASRGELMVDGRNQFLSPQTQDAAFLDGLKFVGVSTPYRIHSFRDESTVSGLQAAYQSTGGNMFSLRRKHVAGGLYFRADIKNDNEYPEQDFEFATFDQGTLYEMLKSDATGPLKQAWMNIKADIKSSVNLANKILGLPPTEGLKNQVAIHEGVWRSNNTTAPDASSNVRQVSSRAWYAGVQDLMQAGYDGYQTGLNYIGEMIDGKHPYVDALISGGDVGAIGYARDNLPFVGSLINSVIPRGQVNNYNYSSNANNMLTYNENINRIYQNDGAPAMLTDKSPLLLSYSPSTLRSDGTYGRYQQY